MADRLGIGITLAVLFGALVVVFTRVQGIDIGF
jgi:hypothetical protein